MCKFRNVVLTAVRSLTIIGSQHLRASEAPDAGAPAQTDTQTDPNAAVASESPAARWLQLDAASFSLRYRDSYDTTGYRIFQNYQQRSLLAGKFKFDKDGKYAIGFRAESGRYFNWGYANFAGGDYKTMTLNAVYHFPPQRGLAVYEAYVADPPTNSGANAVANGWEFYVRDLYLSATPVTGLTVEFGSIGFERGVGSEITTYDEDGYISGERLRLKYPHQLFLDQIEFTSGFVGDIYTPNFFDRYDRLGQSNYRQILGEKRFNSRISASADYTSTVRTSTFREAALVNVHESRVVDGARVELYQRVNTVTYPGFVAPGANGWSFTGTKNLSKYLTIEGGYADIDQDYGVYSGVANVAASGFALNGDSYQVGQRFFGRANVKLATGVSLFGFYTHQIHPEQTPTEFSWTRQNLNLGLQLDFKAMLNKAHIL